MLRRAALLLAIALALPLAGCGEQGERVAPHPETLAGRYEARPEAFHAEVVAALRYELRPVLEGDDPAAAASLQRRLDRAVDAGCAGLPTALELAPDGTHRWRLKEALAASATKGVHLIDLPPPGIDAVYGRTWRQTAPGEIEVVYETRNGLAVRWPTQSRCRVRPDGGLDIHWSRDLELSIEEAPLHPAPQ